MIDKALMAVQSTGLYSIVVLEWNGFDEVNQIWSEFKSHFSGAYDIRLQSGGETANVYHGAVNVYDTADDDDSVGSITQSLTSMHLSNNANAQSIMTLCQQLRQTQWLYAQHWQPRNSNW